MKQRILVKKADNILFDGKLINIPIKESCIVEKSIELFDDDDPCIIHKSYIAKEYASTILDLLNSQKTLFVKAHLDTLAFLDFDDLDTLTLELKG